MTHGEFSFQTYHRKSSFRFDSVEEIQVLGQPDAPMPDNWIRVFFKAYPRFEQLPLPAPVGGANPGVDAAMLSRRSERDFDATTPLSLRSLSRILTGIGLSHEGAEVTLESRRPYPSAGGRYPLEAYVLPLNVAGLAQRVHHYHVRTHRLEKLWEFSQSELTDCFPLPDWSREAAAVIVLTASHQRTSIKYGEKAYRFCLLEAGHAAQNMCLLAGAESVAACPYGGFVDDSLARLLDVNPDEEFPVYTLFVGPRPQR